MRPSQSTGTKKMCGLSTTRRGNEHKRGTHLEVCRGEGNPVPFFVDEVEHEGTYEAKDNGQHRGVFQTGYGEKAPGPGEDAVGQGEDVAAAPEYTLEHSEGD